MQKKTELRAQSIFGLCRAEWQIFCNKLDHYYRIKVKPQQSEGRKIIRPLYFLSLILILVYLIIFINFPADVCLRHPDEAAVGKGYTCYCSAGFIGELCETTIDACDDHPCQGASTCVSELGQYTCICPPTLTGKYCTEE